MKSKFETSGFFSGLEEVRGLPDILLAVTCDNKKDGGQRGNLQRIEV